MGLDVAEANGKFRFLILIAEFSDSRILLRHTQPHYYGKQCGYDYGEDIRMPFQYNRFLNMDELLAVTP